MILIGNKESLLTHCIADYLNVSRVELMDNILISKGVLKQFGIYDIQYSGEI